MENLQKIQQLQKMQQLHRMQQKAKQQQQQHQTGQIQQMQPSQTQKNQEQAIHPMAQMSFSSLTQNPLKSASNPLNLSMAQISQFQHAQMPPMDATLPLLNFLNGPQNINNIQQPKKMTLSSVTKDSRARHQTQFKMMHQSYPQFMQNNLPFPIKPMPLPKIAEKAQSGQQTKKEQDRKKKAAQQGSADDSKQDMSDGNIVSIIGGKICVIPPISQIDPEVLIPAKNLKHSFSMNGRVRQIKNRGLKRSVTTFTPRLSRGDQQQKRKNQQKSKNKPRLSRSSLRSKRSASCSSFLCAVRE